MQIGNILDRSVGFEIEVSDVPKMAIKLPAGYRWSDEQILNSNGKMSTSKSSEFGGELNTPPIFFCREDWSMLESVFSDLINNGANDIWRQGFDGHIYAGDLSLDELKRVFYLSFYTSDFIKAFCDFGEWFDIEMLVPTPSIRIANAVRRANSFEELRCVFVNNLNKGLRMLVNIYSYWHTKTIEFRLFNATKRFSDIWHSAVFMYRYLDYALTHTEDDFRSIDTYEKFIRELKLRYPLAKKGSPFICAADHRSYPTVIQKPIGYSSKMIGKIIEECRGDSITLVNPNLYQLEVQLLDRKDLTIYNSDPFSNAIYLVATGKVQINWSGEFDWLEQYTDHNDRAREVSLLVLFHRMQRYTGESNYKKKKLKSFVDAFPKSLDAIKNYADRVVKLFSTCEYRIGTINDAINNENTVFYEFGDNPRNRTAMRSLEEYSDFDYDFDPDSPNFYRLVEDQLPSSCHLMMVSANEFLPLNKIAKFGAIYFYSSLPAKAQITKAKSSVQPSFPHLVPPDDLSISDYRKLAVVRITPSAMKGLQEAYINMAFKVSAPNIAFAVMYDRYLIGGFGFNLPKLSEYDLLQLTDFATNNNVPRASKLVLLCLLTREVQKILQRFLGRSAKRVYTKAYTLKSTSMKYRGLYKKVNEDNANGNDQDKKEVTYEGELGSIQSMKEAFIRYRQMVEKLK